MKQRLPALIATLLVFILVISCDYLGLTNNTSSPDLAATNAALEAMIVEMAAQNTIEASAKEMVTDTAQPETQTPVVVTATGEATLSQTETQQVSPTATVDIDAQIKSLIKTANVLIYDDPDADLRLVPRVNKAVQEFGFNGGYVVDASNRPGTFDSMLRSQEWDLVILAVESRETVDIGDAVPLTPILEHINRGGALIVETWNLDEDESALGGLLLSVCEAHVEKDWHREEDEERDEFVVYEFPGAGDFFKTPKTVTMPMNPTFFWEGDAGDFIRLDQSSSGKSRILAGELSPDRNNYGLMTSCLDGRMVLQTFSTHDYPLYETVRIWQDTMYYTLYNYFASMF